MRLDDSLTSFEVLKGLKKEVYFSEENLPLNFPMCASVEIPPLPDEKVSIL